MARTTKPAEEPKPEEADAAPSEETAPVLPGEGRTPEEAGAAATADGSKVPEDTEPKKGTATEAVVYGRNDAVVRTYSLEVHGKDFQSLAEEFVSSRAGLRVEIQ